MNYQCHSCGLPVQTERCGDTLHIKPCPKCAHEEWVRGYDNAFYRERERETFRQDLHPIYGECLKGFKKIL